MASWWTAAGSQAPPFLPQYMGQQLDKCAAFAPTCFTTPVLLDDGKSLYGGQEENTPTQLQEGEAAALLLYQPIPQSAEDPLAGYKASVPQSPAPGFAPPATPASNPWAMLATSQAQLAQAMSAMVLKSRKACKAKHKTQHLLHTLIQQTAQGGATPALVPSLGHHGKDTYKAPNNYDGKTGDGVDQFLTTFTIWAGNNQDLLTQDQAMGQWVPWTHQWMMAFLSQLRSNAYVWGKDYLEDLATGKLVFNNDWQAFQTMFLQCFKTYDKGQVACLAIQTIKYKAYMAKDYVLQFNNIMKKTQYSNVELEHYFKLPLPEKVKDRIAKTDLNNVDTLAKLQAFVIRTDRHAWEHKTKQLLQQGNPSLLS
jgi:hypothetical protein